MLPVRAPSWVGVKVTLIMQFAPAASVLPQGFVLVAAAKSPLITMLLMFSVELPVFATVTLLAVLFVPTTVLANTSDVGVRVTTGPLAVTVRVIVVVGFKLPDVPVIVTVDVPVAGTLVRHREGGTALAALRERVAVGQFAAPVEREDLLKRGI